MLNLVAPVLLALGQPALGAQAPTQPARAWAVTIGGSGTEAAGAAAVDGAGYIYVAGTTDSTDFPVTNGAAQTVRQGATDAFVVKLTPDGGTVVFATYLGGSGDESVSGMGVDGAGNVYLGVTSTSNDYPGTSSPCGSALPCGYITKLSADGRSIGYALPVPVGFAGPFARAALGRVVASDNGTVYFRWTLTEFCDRQILSRIPPDGTEVHDLLDFGGDCGSPSGLDAFAEGPANGVVTAFHEGTPWQLHVASIESSGTTDWIAVRDGTAAVAALTSAQAGGGYVLGANLLHLSADGEIDGSSPMQVPADWWTPGALVDAPLRQDGSGRLHTVLCGTSCRAATIDPTGALIASAIVDGGTSSWAYAYGPAGQLAAVGDSGGDVRVALYGDAVISDFSGPVSVRFDTGVTWTAQAIRADAEYKFIRRDPDGIWRVVRDWSTVPAYSWFPTYGDLGIHDLQVWLRTPGSSAVYEDWRSAELTVTDGPLPAITGLTPSVQSFHAGGPITWTADAAGGYGAPQFAFLRLDADGWHLAQPYSSDNSYTWIPNPADLGAHALQVWVRNRDSQATYEAWQTTTFTVEGAAPLTVQIAALGPVPAADTRAITWRAVTTGGDGPLQYEFWRMSPVGSWSLVQDYSASNNYSWRPGLNVSGTYAIQVWVRNNGSTAPYDAWAGTGEFTIASPPTLTLAIQSEPVSPLVAGASASWSAITSTATSTPIEYQFVRLDADGWHIVRPYDTDAGSGSYRWTPIAADAGPHELQVWARRVGSLEPFEGWTSATSFRVLPPAPLTLVASGVPHVGLTTTWTAIPSNPSLGLLYRFLRQDGSGFHLVRDDEAYPQYSWTPGSADVGDHTLLVDGFTVPETTVLSASSTFTVEAPAPPSVEIDTLGPVPSAGIGGTVAWKADAIGDGAPYQYRFVRLDADGWHVVQDFSGADTYLWSPGDADAGAHVIQVWVRNAGSTAVYDAWATTGTFVIPAGR
ncbi:MAG TPA: SBBP repeat-containing protein [Vicinamibacterales bacterium]